MSGAGTVGAALAAVRARVGAAARRAGRSAEEVRLVGVSKGQSAQKVVEAVHAGLTEIGENYLQEALEKRQEVQAALEGWKSTPPRWHFIGHLQRNKARAVAESFDTVQTLDRIALGEALERHAAAAGRRLEALLQVNLDAEPQKGGAAPQELGGLLAASQAWPHLDVVGLMAIPAPGDSPEASRAAFARLRELRDQLQSAPGGGALRELSMGMSADFEVAIEEGATLVRVGTAVFGARRPRPSAG